MFIWVDEIAQQAVGLHNMAISQVAKDNFALASSIGGLQAHKQKKSEELEILGLSFTFD